MALQTVSRRSPERRPCVCTRQAAGPAGGGEAETDEGKTRQQSVAEHREFVRRQSTVGLLCRVFCVSMTKSCGLDLFVSTVFGATALG